MLQSLMRAEQIAEIEKSCAEMEEMSRMCGPLVARYLPLLKNARLSGIGPGDRMILNLRKAQWTDQYFWMHRQGWTRIIGMEVSWL